MKLSACVENLRRAAVSSLVILSLLIIGLSAASPAQELAATLTGTVTDASGAVVSGATVVVHSTETGADVRNVTTSSSGSFNITNLPAGRYTVTVNNAGFQTYVAKDVILNVAEKHTLDVQLKAGTGQPDHRGNGRKHAHPDHDGRRVWNGDRRPGSRAGAQQPKL